MSGPKSICSIEKEERKKKERGMEYEEREGGRKDGRKKGGERERKKAFFSNENICKLKTKSNDFNAVMVIVPDKSVLWDSAVGSRSSGLPAWHWDRSRRTMAPKLSKSS